MLDTPFSFEPDFKDKEFEKIGRLAMRWTHIDHVIANCLRIMLRLSESEADKIVFPMNEDRRLTLIIELSENAGLNEEAKKALRELKWAMGGLRSIRTNVIHAVIMQDDDGEHHFELRSKNRRRYSKKQVFAAEELTNFAAHAVLSLRLALGVFGSEDARHPLPDRPAVPECLRAYFQATNPARRGRRQRPQEPSRVSR